MYTISHIMAKRRRKRRRRRGGILKKVHAIVKKEVGKTRESNKLVSYVAWSRLNDILLSSMPATPGLLNPEQAICCYSLTGGLSSTIDFTQDPTEYISKNLFVLLPSDDTAVVPTALSGVSQAHQGGTASAMDGSAGVGAQTIVDSLANVHQLEGRQCYLKKFYATVCLNNSTASVTTPSNVLVRCCIVSTRRPLSNVSLSTQVLLQNHGTIQSIGGTGAFPPTSALGYLNRDVISKVYFDRTYTLNGAAGASGSLKRFKVKININKKARWSYYYPTRVPAETSQHLTYQGPYLYLIMWASESGLYGSGFHVTAGIAEPRRPAFSLSSILTFMDD